MKQVKIYMENSVELTGKPKRGRPREFDRSEALEKALKLFWRQGYMNTTMSQLCETMGIKSPSLYCAFGCKADLFLEALTYYRETYWSEVFSVYLAEKDIYHATKNLFATTAEVLLLPKAPCGCLTVYSALTLPMSESAILLAIEQMRQETQKMFRDKLLMALREEELPPETDVPVITASLVNFFEGLTLQARREDICLAELKKMAIRGVCLLPNGEKFL